MVQLLNSTVSFGSRTQGTIALSSGETELYAIGQGTSEALFTRTPHCRQKHGHQVWNKQENKARRTEIPLRAGTGSERNSETEKSTN